MRIIEAMCIAAVAFSGCDAPEEPQPESLQPRVLWGAAGEPEVVAEFDAGALQTPESVAVDWQGNLYVALALTGEIWKVTPAGDESLHAQIPIGDHPLQECFGFIGLMHAITVGIDGTLYAAVASCDEDGRGIWRVDPDGQAEVLATVPASAQLNGIAIRRGRVYATDSNQGRVFRTSVFGGEAQVWVQTPLLDFQPNPFGAPGANGIQFHLQRAVVANSSTAQLIEIPTHGLADVAGEPAVLHQLEVACDDFAFDVLGRIYCTTNPFQTVVRVDPDGTQTVVLDAEDGVDGPTSTTFGRLWDSSTLYVSNAAFPFFPGTGHGPTVMALDVGVSGWPLR